MAGFQVGPEQAAEGIGQPYQRHVVHAGLPFPQVVGQQVTDRAALDAAPVDQLVHAEPPVRRQRAHGRCRGAAEDARGVQQLVEIRALVVRDPADGGGRIEQFQAVADGNASDHTSLGRHDDRDPVPRPPERTASRS